MNQLNRFAFFHFNHIRDCNLKFCLRNVIDSLSHTYQEQNSSFYAQDQLQFLSSIYLTKANDLLSQSDLPFLSVHNNLFDKFYLFSPLICIFICKDCINQVNTFILNIVKPTRLMVALPTTLIFAFLAKLTLYFQKQLINSIN